MAETWANNSLIQRGKLLRYYFVDITGRAPVANTAELDKSNVNGANMGNYSANNHPNRTHMENFRNYILTSLRDYVDFSGMMFKTTILDEDIARLYGDDVSGANPVNRSVTFIENTRGASGEYSNASRETGVDHEKYLAGLKTRAILEPDNYIKDAERDKLENMNAALTVYNTSYNKYFKTYQMTKEDAHRLAIRDKEKYQDMLDAQHKLVYKNDTYKNAAEKIYK